MAPLHIGQYLKRCLKEGTTTPSLPDGNDTPPSIGGENYDILYLNFLLPSEEEYPYGTSGGGGGFFCHSIINQF
jgi:hypothetical protein